jgi:hypothetical protein
VGAEIRAPDDYRVLASGDELTMAEYHTVEQGECLASIAKKYGFPNYKKIYDHPENSELKQNRPNPNLLCPGDSIFIPDTEVKDYSRPTEKKHSFKLHRQPTVVRIVVADEKGKPYSGNKYKLTIGYQTYEGTTGADGLIEQKVEADEEQGELTVWWKGDPQTLACTWTLQIGHLDPVGETTGIQGRLNNLGFDCGLVDGIVGPKTEAAVRSFQEEHSLKVDGIPGPKTQAKLKEVHGC